MCEFIYLDNNATTPVDDTVLEAMLPFFCRQFGNPDSPHSFGRAARDAVESARSKVANLIGAGSGSIVFTSSATEANNLFLKGALTRGKRNHVVCSTVEHKSVLAPLRSLEGEGHVELSWCKPDVHGQVRGEHLASVVRRDTRLVSIMAANNVVHTINPLEEIAAACSETDAMLHSDATQLVGRQPIDVEGIGIDALSISAHKMYGPKGIGALYLSRFAIKAGLVPLIDGGGQEYGFRSGTLNVAAIVGFGAACELAAKRMFEDATRLRKLAVLFMDELRGRLSDFELNGHPVDRLPGGIHLTFEGVDSRALIAAVPQVAFSDGSACETGHEPDHVIGQLGKREAAHCSIRIQIGRMTSRAEVVRSAELIAAGAQSLKHHRIARRRAGPQV